MNKFLLFLIPIFFISCSTQPIFKVYTLKTPTIKKVSSHKYTNKILKVMYPQSLKTAITQKILFSYSASEQGSYENAQWSNSMSKLLEGTFVEVMEESGLFKSVISYTSTAHEDFRLESNIFELSHKVREGSSESIVSIAFSLIRADKSIVIDAKKFTYIIPTKTTNAKGYVDATNQALNQMSHDLIEWLK